MSNLRVICRGKVVSLDGEGSEPVEISGLAPANCEAAAASVIRSPQRVEDDFEIYNMRLLLEHAVKEMEAQAETSRHVDSKAGVILGFASLAMAQVLVSVLAISSATLTLIKSHPIASYVVLNLAIVSLGSMLCAVIYGLSTLKPRTLFRASVAPGLAKAGCPTKELLQGCLEGLGDGMSQNQKVHEEKLRESRKAAYAVGAGIVGYIAIAASVLGLLVLS